jgi:hypothetical protein
MTDLDRAHIWADAKILKLVDGLKAARAKAAEAQR